MEENKKNNNTKTIILTVIITIGVGLLAYFAYQYYDDLKWKNYDKKHSIDDNLLTVKCMLEDGEENIVSCNIDTEEKINEYDSLSIYIDHSDSVKYLSHHIPTEENIYNSHDTTTYRSEKVEDRFFISGFDKTNDIDYLLNIKFKVEDANMANEELNFRHMAIIKDFVDHNTNDVVIKLGELTTVEKDENGAYKYLCLNKDLEKDAIINRSMLTECISEKELTASTLTDNVMKVYGLDLNDDKIYYIKNAKKANDFLTLEDIYWELEAVKETTIKNPAGIEYTLKIGEDKLLYLNDKKIFDKTAIKEFYVRPYCCAGSKKVILLTEDNNTYISEDYIDLKLETTTFKDLNLTNVKEFHINLYAPSMAGMHVYAIDNNGEEHLVD